MLVWHSGGSPAGGVSETERWSILTWRHARGGAPVQSRQALAARLRGLGLPPRFAGLLAAAGDGPSVLAHGDFGFNQVLWEGGRVTALLDLEMAHAETPDWDLGGFLATCLDPARMAPAHVAAASRPEDYREAPIWLREAYPELCAAPALRERLALQALVLRWPELLAAPDRRDAIIEAAVAWAAPLEQLLR